MAKNCLFAKTPLLLAALLFGAVAADPPAARAEEPKNFPDGQTVPKPGPITPDNTVTLWQLPEELKAIIETDNGEFYGIYYSAWSDPLKDNKQKIPGVSAPGWITGANVQNVPWQGDQQLALELSQKYYDLKKDFFSLGCGVSPQSGSNETCVAENKDGETISNLYLYGYWNGGGFAFASDANIKAKAQPRPNNGSNDNNQINYYWNGDLYRTIATDKNLRIQAFAGCKLNDQGTISAGKMVATSALAPAQNCELGVAPVFEGGTLFAEQTALNLDENFAIVYGLSEDSDDLGGAIDNRGQNLSFAGRFDSFGDGAKGRLTFTGLGSTTIQNQVNLRGDLVVEQGSLTITSPSGLFVAASQVENNSQGASVGSLSLVPTPLQFENSTTKDGFKNTITISNGAVLRVAGDDLSDGVGPRKPGESDEPINGDGNRRSPVISFGDGDDTLNVEQGGLLVASYVGMLPSEYDLYKNNCRGDSAESTCFRAIPQIDFGVGANEILNKGAIVGPGETSIGNFLEIILNNGDDKVVNNGYLGCLTGGADEGGWNGFKGQNTCRDAAGLVGGDLPESNDLGRNYNVNLLFKGGADVYRNFGYHRGPVNMSGGDDRLESSGGLRGGITMGAGNDTLQIEANGSWVGSGIVDDWIAFGNSRFSDSSKNEDNNTLTLVGDAIVSFRNSLGFDSDQCGSKSGTSGGYGCRWQDQQSGDYGYNYLAIAGSQGSDNIVVQNDSVFESTDVKTEAGAQIWGSVELGDSNDSLKLKAGTHLDLVGDLDLGSGDSQLITVAEDADFSVRAIKGSDVDLSIAGTATLGGDTTLGVFEVDSDVELSKSNTLSFYTGTTTIQEGGTLRVGQAWSLSSESIHQVDGELVLGDNPERNGNKGREDQAIGELTGEGLVRLQNGSHLFYGGLNGDVEFSGTSDGKGSLVKEGSGTTTFTGTFGHSGYTKVHDGTLLLKDDGSLSTQSTVLISSSTNQPTLDLGGTTQDAPKYNLHGGTLKNGTLGAAEINAERRKNNIIDGVDGELVSVNASSGNAFEEDVELTFTGSNQFKNLEIDRALVEIDAGASLSLVDGITGGSFAPKGGLSFQDRLDVQGSLITGDSIDLGAGNDVFRIGDNGSVTTNGVVQGGAGEFDVFWNENVNLNFSKSDIEGFEIVAYAGEGLAYLGEKTSAIITANEFEVPYTSVYGYIESTASNNSLVFGTADANLRDSKRTQVGLLRLDGDSTDLRVLSGELEIAALESPSGSVKNNTFTLGSAAADATTTANGFEGVASGRLAVGASDGSISAMRQLGGIWNYEGDFSNASLSAQGVVVVGTDSDSNQPPSSASFQSITANGSRRLLVGTRANGSLTLTGGLHDTWGEISTGAAAPKKAALLVNGDVELGSLTSETPSTYSGATVVMEQGTITTLDSDAISPASPTLVRGVLNVGTGSSDAPVTQTFARRLVVAEAGSINNGNLSVTSLANAGDVSIQSLTVNNGMSRILDRLSSSPRFAERLAPLSRINAQGSFKNLGGSIKIARDLIFEDNNDSDAGHALINATALRKRTLPVLEAGRILMGNKNDLIFNAGEIATFTGQSTSINLRGGNDLILNRGFFNIGNSIIDGGEPLEISGLGSRETRSVKGLNIFRGATLENPGIDESQLVNFAAIKLTVDSDWVFPQGKGCRVRGEGRVFDEDEYDCVGIAGEREVDQYMRITDGATVATGFVELGRSSDNSIEVLDGTLRARLIDGVVGDFSASRDDGALVFNRDISLSENSLLIGTNQTKGDVEAEAIHNISSIQLINGSLDVDLLHAADLPDPELLIGSSLQLGALDGEFDRDSLADYLASNISSGSITLGESVGYAKATQLGGVWGYEGDFSDIDLYAQGVVTTPQVSFLEKEEATFGSITASGDHRLLVGARADGALTINEGLYEVENSSKAAILNRGVMTLGGDDASKASTYTGATVLLKGSTLTTLSDNAISSQSPTLVRGLLQLGDPTSGSVQQDFGRRLIVSSSGEIQNGDLSVTSLTNAGVVNVDSLKVNNGMTTLLDVLRSQGMIASNSRLLDIKAQGSLKNLGGRISIAGDLIYNDDPKETNGHALLNVRNPRLGQNFSTMPSLTARRIQMGSSNDVILNSGTISTTTREKGVASIDLKGGNDLIMNRGVFDIGKSFIDGGEPLELNSPLTTGQPFSIRGLNIFRQGDSDPGLPIQGQGSGLKESQLVNFAAIKLDADGDWIFPFGNNCQRNQRQKVFRNDAQCVGVLGNAGRRSAGQIVLIDEGARLDAGVVSLGRGLANNILIRNGGLRAVLIEGVDEEGYITLGKFDSEGDSSGELIVGGMVSSETGSIRQLGGRWSYSINAPSSGGSAISPEVTGVFPRTVATGTMVIEPTMLDDGFVKDVRLVDRASFQSIEGFGRLKIKNSGTLTVLNGIQGDETSLEAFGVNDRGAEVRLSGSSGYRGLTTIGENSRLIAENNNSLSPNSPTHVLAGGVIDLQGFDNSFSQLSGDGTIFLGARFTTTADSNSDPEGAELTINSGSFSGSIEDGGLTGLGAVIKDGSGSLLLNGFNEYSAPTKILDGTLTIGNPLALSPNSPITITGGQLNLSSVARSGLIPVTGLSDYRYSVDSLTLRDQGSLYVSSLAPLNVQGAFNFQSGTIAAFLDTGSDSRAPIRISDQSALVYGPAGSELTTFDAPGRLFMVLKGDQALDGESTWNVIDGEVENSEQLAENTFLLVPAEAADSGTAPTIPIEGRRYRIAKFDGIDQPLADAALNDVVLEKGSLKLVIKPKSAEDIKEDLGIGGGQVQVAGLPGCEANDPFCDAISDTDGQQDQASDRDELTAGEIIDVVIDVQQDSAGGESSDGDPDESLQLPVVFDYGQLARLVVSGLAPRNVDAPGRGLFNYNNLLVDTVFERLPIRQVASSEPVLPAASAPDQESSSDGVAREPVRALWSQDALVDSQGSQQFVDLKLAKDGEGSSEAVSDDQLPNSADQQESLTAELSNREGVRAWFRGFGGDTGPTTTTDTFANDYSATAGGAVLGVDVSVTPSVQVGVFANYGDVNVYQYGEAGGGSWSSDGWGAGLRADWWTDHFYVQGMFSVSAFEGSQSRNIVSLTEDLGGKTASGDKSATSYATAFRVGAPFQTGNLLLEPQFTLAWTQNQEDGFSENGADNLNLRYGSRTTNYLQTELGMKLSLPINSGERGLWVPNLRVAWLGDWDQNNEDQTIGYSFTDSTVGVASQEDDNNGVLIEAGLDYTMANINSGSWKLYVRGGAEVWGGERGTDWRASGGMTWQF